MAKRWRNENKIKTMHANFTIEIVINGKIEKQTVNAGVGALQICGFEKR